MSEARRLSACKRGYDRTWQKERAEHLKLYPFCVDPYRVHGFKDGAGGWHPVPVLAKHLDHIVPHEGNAELFKDKANRQGLCESCHSIKTAKEDGGFGRKSNGINI